MSRISSFSEWILRLPLVWGGVASLAFYAALSQGWIASPLIRQYTANNFVEYVECVLFFVGLAALVLRFIQITGQFATLDRVEFEPIPRGGQSTKECDRLLAQLAELPVSTRNTYLARRLYDALEYVRRKCSADAIDQQLRHLQDQDVGRMMAGYSLVRIIVWAIPILGFLGTVIGITTAIFNLSPQDLEQSMPKVTSGLGVAFDTTAVALALTMVLMFVKYCVERMEDRLLAMVDERVEKELVGRFHYSGIDDDPNVAAIRRMTEQVINAVEAMTTRQADVWKTALDATHQQWADVSFSAGKIINDSLSASLQGTLEVHAQRLNEGVEKHADRLSQSSESTVGHLREGLERLAELLVESLHKHGNVLTASEKELAEENRKHLSEVEAALGEAMVVAADRQEQLIHRSEDLLKDMQVALVEAAGATLRQQEQLVKQGDVLLRVVDATGQVKQLEETLNENLSALAQAQHFDELALNLTAAIQMLCARVGHFPNKLAAAEPNGKASANQAA